MWLTNIIALALLPSCAACTLLIRGVDNGGENQWKRGQVVAIYEDRPTYGTKEVPPEFYRIRLPGVPVAVAAAKLLRDEINEDGTIVRRRAFRIRVVDMPLAARNKLQSTGELVIKVAAYWDNQSVFTTWDYTWANVVGYFRNDKTNTDEAPL
jgi:hypothetical protein